MRKIVILSLIASVLMVCSCKDDLDVNAEWKSIPVVYALLSQSDTVHYVKVNKAFLGDAPASQMAQISDSLFYDDAVVYIDKMRNGNLQQRINFNKIDTIAKPEGYFASDRNTLYAWKGNLDAGSDYSYILYVEIPSDGIKCKSQEISLVDNVKITKPSSSFSRIGLTQIKNGKVTTKYKTGNNGSVYQMFCRFYYIEVNNETHDTIKNLEPVTIALSLDNYTEASVEITKEFAVSQFYQLVDDNLDPKPGYTRFLRKPYPFEFTLYAADKYYKTYSEISAPSSGIVQEKPFYSNIENGVGLFAARFQTTSFAKPTYPSIDSLSFGRITKHLGFAPRTDPYYIEF